MQARPDGVRGSRDAGTGTLEYVAALALASLVIASVVLSVTGARLDVVVVRAICSVKAAFVGGTCAPSEHPRSPTSPSFDPKPNKCKVQEHSEKVNSEVKIAFVKIGENAGFVQTTYSNGSVTFTATDGAEVGVTGGFGGKLDVGKLERGAKVDFGAGLKFDYGSTWVFKDAGEAKSMRDQLDKYLGEQQTLRHDSSGGYSIYLALRGATDPPKPPSLQVSTVEVSADAEGKVGLSLPFNPDPQGEPDGPKLTLAEAGLKFGASNKWTQINDLVTGATTWTTGGEIYGQGSVAVGPLAAELRGVLGSSMAITRDKNNQITKVTLVTTQEGKATGTGTAGQPTLGGSASNADSANDITVTTTSLDVSSDSQRSLVNHWLAAQASDPAGAVSPQTYFPDVLVNGDRFQNLMYTNATVSNVHYRGVSDKTGFAAEVKLGVSFGIDLSLETTDTKAVAATYLDVPLPNGTRPPVNFQGCVSR